MQRVSRASVTVAGEVVGAIDRGLLVYLGVGRDDDERAVAYTVEKVVGLRVFEDDAGKMGRDVAQAGGALLVVSQFTLYGDVRKGRRPDFTAAKAPDEADALYRAFVEAARARGITVATGVFRADMKVESVNDGPVTLLVDSARGF